jgi:IS30 family transposase
MIEALKGFQVDSITLDNGSEFADFRRVEKELKTTVYFADPHAPWQRPTNENTNGLLRFFFPKGTDFLKVSAQEVKDVLSLINNRPRKCLGWLSPAEIMFSKCCT